ncbi:MAG TPA: AMP-binding protein [Ornithinimicrobium sp.]|uniref:AMP-binding protein n=1 Tax=Ornithinimicrobium sp. TaxID=1977084 RepID=UPI002B45ACF5|nr:AMP-binding protein [Ornithinimicrobium sp.]HKJ10761.1 AMP-binding protein [Ornithinimicrobium sp.]
MDALDLTGAGRGEVVRLVQEAVAAQRAVVVPTSGSSGPPKRVLLSMSALKASAESTLSFLGGPGQWLAALSPRHIGGLQVYLRSAVSGIPPATLEDDGPFGAGSFTAAVAAMRPGTRHYAALVPTQVHRLLAEPAGREALASLDRVLIGGAPLPAASVAALDRAGVRWTHTYGMTETAGGCVYDGVPLPGVAVRLEQGPAGGRILLSGPILAQGYLQDPVATAEAFVTEAGVRWYRTSDLGRYDEVRRRWKILGRVDEVINTGGHKVHPDDVSSALCAMEPVVDAAVVALPDPQWGERVVAMLVPAAGGPPVEALTRPTGWVRSRLRETLPRYALPTQVRWSDTLPRLASGKVDHAGVRAAFTQEGERL